MIKMFKNVFSFVENRAAAVNPPSRLQKSKGSLRGGVAVHRPLSCVLVCGHIWTCKHMQTVSPSGRCKGIHLTDRR